jgi:hypothetical protein
MEIPDVHMLFEMKKQYLTQFLNWLVIWAISSAGITIALKILFDQDLNIIGTLIGVILGTIWAKNFFETTIFSEKLLEKSDVQYCMDITPSQLESFLISYPIPDRTNPLHAFQFRIRVFWLLFLICVIISYFASNFAPFLQFFLLAVLNISCLQVLSIKIGSSIERKRLNSSFYQSKEHQYLQQNYKKFLQILPQDTNESIHFRVKIVLNHHNVSFQDTKLIITNKIWKEHGIKSMLLQVKVTPHMNYPYLVVLCDDIHQNRIENLNTQQFNLDSKYPMIFEASNTPELGILVGRLEIQAKNEVPSVDFNDLIKIGKMVMNKFIQPIINS